ncbi:hypothetical protein FDM56_13990 [Vibrio cholerae]|nr:hypothetical protein [Vibrio cholerae]EGR4062055.1 hypothetical protein [Vibrio cholerae]EGR4421053.1 hypothetical protein [Vibrio cholerae]EGR4431953.1 hypothetical protein [Vibrio cholerae]KAA1208620.1 hypothetical protein F0Q16_12035 [Vibrio cholerae]
MRPFNVQLRFPCRAFILNVRFFFLKITNPWCFPVPCQYPSDEVHLTELTLLNKQIEAISGCLK